MKNISRKKHFIGFYNLFFGLLLINKVLVHSNLKLSTVKPSKKVGKLLKFLEPEFQMNAMGGISVNINSYPFAVSLREHQKHICGGVILNAQTILSTAHCFKRNIPLQLYTVHIARTKKYGVEEGEQVFKITKILIHPHYNKDLAFNNDIILVKLNGSIIFNSGAQPATLPTPNEVLPAGSYCCVVGWGETAGLGNANLLNEACLSSWHNKKCNHTKYYNGKISPNMFCAGEETGGVDACRGDSGGPLYCHVGSSKKVWGLVSWGTICLEVYKPGVYVNLARYMD